MINEEIAMKGIEHINKKQSEIKSKADYIVQSDMYRMFIIMEMLEREMEKTTCVYTFPLDYITSVTERIKKERGYDY